MDNKKEINWEYKIHATRQRHETVRTIGIAFGVVTVLCSLIWAICLFNLEAVKHPVQVNNQNQTNYERK